eukprot:3544925-Pleurochrysis_carterae.AAC.1
MGAAQAAPVRRAATIPPGSAALGGAARAGAAQRRYTWMCGAAIAALPPGIHRRLHRRSADGRGRPAGGSGRGDHRPHPHTGGRGAARATHDASPLPRAAGGTGAGRTGPARSAGE